MKYILSLVIAFCLAACQAPTTSLQPASREQPEFTSQDANIIKSWTKVRQTVYSQIDDQGGKVQDVYSGKWFKMANKNAKGMNIEHTWPAEAGWGPIGRDSKAAHDLHNLFPASSGINQSRSNHPFGEPQKRVTEYYVNADGKLNKQKRGHKSGSVIGYTNDGRKVFKPRAEHRGNVARAMFYMSQKYQKRIPQYMETVLRKWHKQDKVDSDEEDRMQRIQRIQGNANPFIEQPELVDQILDF